MSCGRWSKKNFEKHHEANPQVYRAFVHYAKEAAKVRPYYSAKAIFHRVRWHSLIEEKQSEFKIDDGWISHYARKFMEDYPEHDGFFKLRTRREGYHD